MKVLTIIVFIIIFILSSEFCLGSDFNNHINQDSRINEEKIQQEIR